VCACTFTCVRACVRVCVCVCMFKKPGGKECYSVQCCPPYRGAVVFSEGCLCYCCLVFVHVLLSCPAPRVPGPQACLEGLPGTSQRASLYVREPNLCLMLFSLPAPPCKPRFTSITLARTWALLGVTLTSGLRQELPTCMLHSCGAAWDACFSRKEVKSIDHAHGWSAPVSV